MCLNCAHGTCFCIHAFIISFLLDALLQTTSLLLYNKRVFQQAFLRAAQDVYTPFNKVLGGFGNDVEKDHCDVVKALFRFHGESIHVNLKQAWCNTRKRSPLHIAIDHSLSTALICTKANWARQNSRRQGNFTLETHSRWMNKPITAYICDWI